MINHGTLGYPIFRQTHTEPAEHHKKCQCFGPTWTKKLRCQKKTRNAIRPPSTIDAVETDSPLLQSALVAMRQVRRFESQNSWKLLLMAHLSCSAASRSFWHQDIKVAIYLGSKSWSCQLGGTYSSVQQPASYDSGTPNNIYTSKYKKMAGSTIRTHWP